MFIIQTPARYLQGKGLIDELGEHVKVFGTRFLILSGKTALRMKKEIILSDFSKHDLEAEIVEFCGESTMDEILRVKGIAEEKNVDAIIGMGGGKALDTAKSAANKVNKPVVIVPTIAASDAPCSCESMIYSEEGEVVDFEVFDTNPNLVLVDTDMIANAPVHTLVAGIGDAAATWVEARTCYENDFENCHGMKVSETAIGLARLCYEILMKHGVAAVKANEIGKATSDLEKVVEANIYLSGVGFENGGLSCAHSIHDALTLLPECHKYMHGFKVAFGTLCQLVLEHRPKEEIDEYIAFSARIGLPITLEEVGITDGIEDKVKIIAENAYITDPNHECKMPPKIGVDDIYAAVIAADELGRAYLGK